MPSTESNPVNLKDVKEAPDKTARKRLFSGVLKQYFFFLVIVTIIAAIVFVAFIMWEQNGPTCSPPCPFMRSCRSSETTP